LSLIDELKRRNVFKLAAAYIIVGWLIMQAGEVMGPALHLPEWVNSLLAFHMMNLPDGIACVNDRTEPLLKLLLSVFSEAQ
jgi:hypothetical protein